MGTRGTEVPAPLSTAPWAPRCCCRARGVRLSGAGVAPSWARPQPRGWSCPTPAWPTRATTAATTLSPARPGPPSACGWATRPHHRPSSAGPPATPTPDPPSPPSIECRATSYPQAVNCSWQLSPDPLLDTDFVATYRHGTDSGECSLTGPWSCSFGDLQVFSLTPYELNVTARNALGAATRTLLFLLENIVKPDPPEALQVSPIPGEPQKLLVEWSPPSSWPFPEYFPLQYRIRYSWDNNSVPTTVGPYELTSHTLTDLQPGSLHHIQVAAKDLADCGEFSAWSPPASGTPWLGL
uniref:Epstein-Barr virus induced 3 n=1 Tax=Ficedula albicollis TaxID=59894 RepID=U3JDW9_FICAL